MITTYSATYHSPDKQQYLATIILSSVTLTVQYTDEEGNQKEIHWLGDDIQQLETRADDSYYLHHQSKQGEVSILHFRDPKLFQAIRKNFRHQKFVGNMPARAMNSFFSKFLVMVSIFIGLFLIGYWWLAPWLGERMASGISKDTEISIGKKMYESISMGEKIDTGRTKLINEFYKQLNYKTTYPIEITVVSSPEVNAFAIPGGHIVVYDAILDNMKTPEELAALLGHEVSHIELRHSLKNISRTLARQMFLSLVLGSESGFTSVLVEHADNLKGLEYSRELETESDNNGIRLMHESHINTEGMSNLMTLLQKSTGGKDNTLNFLSTHPVFEKRIANIKEQLKKYVPAPTENVEIKNTFHALYETF
ncbi:M48 family metallopeptidase [Pseudoflavitalea sp. G-6-1-2]|uniref:M48 family metallopeptidase n=1 Tax=Pseudoflavitalea sp. G-6-1-2 TaxID=2728841 RepID=UPI00146E2BC0|nr:M48 family metallopeptidase [Pseudoflavitalea sp. G-6-1-2]NML21016.1 M48 family metallopeptidase [Pseudoflavitalea sp. G-6-1-2]